MKIYFNQKKTAEDSEILFLEAKINSTLIHLKSGIILKVAKTLKKFDNQTLPSHFFRVNRKQIVNFNFVNEIERKGEDINVKMDSEIVIKISRRRRMEFKYFVRKLRK